MRKPRPTVTFSVKVPVELGNAYYKLVNQEYDGNVSAALRVAMSEQLIKHGYEISIEIEL